MRMRWRQKVETRRRLAALRQDVLELRKRVKEMEGHGVEPAFGQEFRVAIDEFDYELQEQIRKRGGDV